MSDTLPVEQANSGYVTVENRDGKLRMAIPVLTDPIVLLIVGAMLFVFTVLEIQALSALMSGQVPDGFMTNGGEIRSTTDPRFIYGLVGGTAAYIYLAYFFLLLAGGKEVIELDLVSLRQRKLVFGLGRSREFKVAKISGLRLAPEMPQTQRNQWSSPLRFDNGAICFDYGGETRFLGSGLDAGERRFVIDEMCKKVGALAAD